MKPRFQQGSKEVEQDSAYVGPEARGGGSCGCPVSPGLKMDSGKPQLGLLFMAALRPAVISLVRILEYGATKYPATDNWTLVENGVSRYRDAALRHLAASAAGECLDDESGLPHLAHAACSALFALALEDK